MANADISLLFGVLGEGSLSGASGSLIQGQLAQIMAELNKNPLKVKVALDTEKGGQKSWSSQLQTKLNELSSNGKFSVQISKLTLGANAISDFRSQLNAVINTLHLDNGVSITLTAEGIGEIKSSMQQAGDAAADAAGKMEQERAAATAAASALNSKAEAERNNAEATENSAEKQEKEFKASKAREAMLKRAYTLLSKLQKAERDWTKARDGKSAPDYAAIRHYIAELSSLIAQYNNGDISAEKFAAKLSRLDKETTKHSGNIKVLGENTKTATERIGGLASKFTTWFSITRVIMAIVRAIRQMVSIVMELDSALTQLKIVTGATDSEMERFLARATDLAKGLGRSITDLLSSIETFSRLGYNLEEASTLAEFANVLANVAAVDTDTATTGLTSIIKGFNMDVAETEHVADVLVEVGQKYAVSASEMMEAYEKSGAALNATNTSFEKSAGLIAAANASVQNASTVGTALKTISARIRGAKSDLEELGEDTSDLAEGFSKYAKEIKALTGFDMMVEGTTNTYKDIYDIFEGISKVWDELSDTQQARVSEILGGTRQLQVVSSILGNWKDAAGAYADAMDSAGTATEANAIYMDSIKGRLEKLKATFQELSNTLIASDFIKQFVDLGITLLNILNGVAKVIDGLGGLNTALIATAGIIATIKAGSIVAFFTGTLPAAIARVVSALKNFVAIFWRVPDVIKTFNSGTALAVPGTSRFSAALKGLGISASTAQAALGALTLVITVATMLFQQHQRALEEGRQKMDEAANAADEERESLSDLIDEYKRLASLGDWDEHSRETVKNLQQQITDLVGSQADNLDLVNGKLDDEIAKLDEIAYKTALENSGALENSAREAQGEYGSGLATTDSVGLGPIQFEYPTRLKGDDEKWFRSAMSTLQMLNEGKFGERVSIGSLTEYGSLFANAKNAQEVLDLYKEVQTVLRKNENLWYGSGEGGLNDSVSESILEFVQREIDNYTKIVDEYEQARKSSFENDAIIQQWEQIGSEPGTQNEFDNYIDYIDRISEVPATTGIENTTENLEEYKAVLKELAIKTFPEFAKAAGLAQDPDILNNNEPGALADLSDILSKIKSSYDVLEISKSEMASGNGLSVDTIQKLASAEKNYLDYLYEENGVIKLNTKAWKENANAKMQGEMDKIQKEIDALEKQRNTLSEQYPAVADYYDELEKAKEKGIDLNKTVYGNINTNDRQVLRWTEENLRTYEEALMSWGHTIDEMRGKYSTVDGMSAEFNGVEIAFTPMLQTEHGAVYLDKTTLDKYIYGLLDKVGENWESEDLYQLDMEGLEIDGQAIKGLLAGVADTAREAGEAMHFTGNVGSVADAYKQVKAAASEAGVSVFEYMAALKENYDLTAKNQALLAKYEAIFTQIEAGAENLIGELSDVVAQYDLLTKAQEEFSSSGNLSASTLSSIVEKFPAMRGNIELYIAGLKTGNELLADLSTAYDTDLENYRNTVIEKMKSSEEFYSSLDDEERTSIDNLSGLYSEYCKTIAGLQGELVDALDDSYEIDLSNFKTIEQKKVAFQAEIVKQLARNYSKYANASLEGLQAEYDHMLIDTSGQYTAEEIQAVKAAIEAIKKYNAEIDKIANGHWNGWDFDPDKFKNGNSSEGSKDKDNSDDKDVEEYIADIDAYREAVERLRKAQEKTEGLETQVDDTGDFEKKIALSKELTTAYEDEQEALRTLHNERATDISAGVAKLRGQGFVIDYDSVTNELWIRNLEHLNELTAENKSEYDTLQEATNALRQETEEYINSLTELNDSNIEGEERLATLSKSLKDAAAAQYEYAASIHESVIALTEQHLNQAVEQGEIHAAEALTNSLISRYRAMQDAVHQEANYYRSLGLADTSEEISGLIKRWWEYEESIKSVKQNVVDSLLDMTAETSDALGEVQSALETLMDAAQEYADNGGFLSVDSVQAIFDLGPEYLSYLEDENGQLVINKERIQRVIAAKTRQLAVDNALSYVERLRLALESDSIENLQQLLTATTDTTNATWGLVYANLKLLDLSDAQYQQALKNINAMRALADSAADNIGNTAGDLTGSLEDMQGGLDDLIGYVMDMLKEHIEDQIDDLEKMKDAYSEIIKKKKESLKATKDEADYEKDRGKKLKEMAKLQARLDLVKMDNSRAGQAEQAKLAEELAKLQEELTDSQADRALEATTDSLDKMEEAYSEEKDREIKKLQQSISSYEKLYDKAIAYITDRWGKDWRSLYDRLSDWNYEHGSTLQSTIKKAWDDATEAVKRYGSVVSAIPGLKADIAAGSSGNGSSQDNSASSQVGNTAYGDETTKEDEIGAIIHQMWVRSQSWASATESERIRLAADNDEDGAELRKRGIPAIRGTDGVWYLSEVGGKKLFEEYRKYCKGYTYHTGGIAGNQPTLKQNEVMAILKKGEPVLDKEREAGLYRIIDFVDVLGAKLGKVIRGNPIVNSIVGAKSGLTDLNHVALESITNNQSKTVQFGDVIIYGANEETVEKHREVNRQFTNEVLRQLNIKK